MLMLFSSCPLHKLLSEITKYKTITVPVDLKRRNMRSLRVREERKSHVECLKNELCVLRKNHLLRSNEKDRMHIQFVEMS